LTIEAVLLTTETLHLAIAWVKSHGGEVPWSGINISGVSAVSVVNPPAVRARLGEDDPGEMHAPVGRYLVLEDDGSFVVYTAERFTATHQPLS
jgi:hypothetical protein